MRASPTATHLLEGVGGEVDCVDVVQLHKQKPACLCHAIGHDAVLRLSTQMRDNVLALRGPGDEVVAQKHCVARSGLACVGTTRPVSISVDDEIGCRGTTKEAMVEGVRT
jgi:hypothetical protein